MLGYMGQKTSGTPCMNHLISVYVQEVYKTTIIRQILAIQDVIRADPKFAIVKGPAGAQYCPK